MRFAASMTCASLKKRVDVMTTKAVITVRKQPRNPDQGHPDDRCPG